MSRDQGSAPRGGRAGALSQCRVHPRVDVEVEARPRGLTPLTQMRRRPAEHESPALVPVPAAYRRAVAPLNRPVPSRLLPLASGASAIRPSWDRRQRRLHGTPPRSETWSRDGHSRSTPPRNRLEIELENRSRCARPPHVPELPRPAVLRGSALPSRTRTPFGGCPVSSVCRPVRRRPATICCRKKTGAAIRLRLVASARRIAANSAAPAAIRPDPHHSFSCHFFWPRSETTWGSPARRTPRPPSDRPLVQDGDERASRFVGRIDTAAKRREIIARHDPPSINLSEERSRPTSVPPHAGLRSTNHDEPAGKDGAWCCCRRTDGERERWRPHSSA